MWLELALERGCPLAVPWRIASLQRPSRDRPRSAPTRVNGARVCVLRGCRALWPRVRSGRKRSDARGAAVQPLAGLSRREASLPLFLRTDLRLWGASSLRGVDPFSKSAFLLTCKDRAGGPGPPQSPPRPSGLFGGLLPGEGPFWLRRPVSYRIVPAPWDLTGFAQ